MKPISSATEAMNEVTSTKNLQGFPKWQILEEGSTAKLPRKRFFEPPPNEELQKPIGGTLDPRCKRQRRATLLTDDGPIDVSIVPSKAVRCPGKTDKYRCPVTNCRLKGRQGSRVFISRHFCEEHKDFRSWRDVFIKKDAPPFILKDADPPKSGSPIKSLDSPSASAQRCTPSPKASHMSSSSMGRQEEDEPLHALEKHVKFSVHSQEEEISPPIMTAQSSSITSGTETSWAQTAPICASSEVQSGQICTSSETQNMVYQTSPQMIPQVLPQVSQAPQNSVPIRSEPMVTVQVPASSFFSSQNLAQPMIPQSFPMVNPYQQMSQVPQAQNVPMALVPLSMLSGLQAQNQQCVPQVIYPQQSDQGQGVQFLSPPGPVNMAPIPNNSCTTTKTENSEIMVQGQKYKIIQVAVPSKITPPSAVKGGPINESHKPVHLLPISQASPLWHQVVSSLNSPTPTSIIGQSQASNTKVVSSGTDPCQPIKPISNIPTSQSSNPSLGVGPGSQAFGLAPQYHPQLQQVLHQSQQQQHHPMTFQYVQPTQQVPQIQAGLPHHMSMNLVSMSQLMPQHQQQPQQQPQPQAYPHNQPQQTFMIPMYAQPQQQPQQ
ncbi:RNA-binding protein 33-like [Tigriopus californicus]|uniref:RNA-binding protein 33-like n=1 Tax=Tigriopus californicus TaxID=6832 RepID=UPI0027DA897F|nr:RNA-binding protein 33-like [Tigriopus californicus]